VEHPFLLCVDARFPGGTSSAVISEIKALASCFEPDRVAILVVESALFAGGMAVNRELAESLSSSPFPVYRFDPHRGEFVDWNSGTHSERGLRRQRFLHAGYLIVHNPYVVTALAPLTGRLSADFALIICHQPYTDASGTPYYSVSELANVVGELAPEMRFVPIGPVVREGFERGGWTETHVARFDWPNVFDFPDAGDAIGGLRARSGQGMLTIGRHSRPDWAKWPESREEFSRIYQYASARRVRFLGWGPYCDRLFQNDIPENWEPLPFNAVTPPAFLATLDAFVYYHHSNWVEGFGRTVLEAIAAGLPCILAPSLAQSFGGAALYAPPDQVTAYLQKLDDRRDALQRWTQIAYGAVQEVFGSKRIQDIYQTLNETSPCRTNSFSSGEAQLRDMQRLHSRFLASGFALQETLGLACEPGERSKIASASADAVAAEQAAAETDFAIYMDLRSARSDLWRTIELAESLLQAGERVSIVHVQSRVGSDSAALNPLLGELSDEIALYGIEDTTGHILIRKALIIAAPQRLVDEDGSALFDNIVRPVAPATVVLVDRKLPSSWFERADNAFALLSGQRPIFALIGTAKPATEHLQERLVEAPDLVAFVARRNPMKNRELLQYLAPRQELRCARIGLMDETQWQTGEMGPVEDLDVPFFCYASLSARLIPQKLHQNPHFQVFRNTDIGFQRFLEKVDIATYFPSTQPNELMLIPLLRAVQAGVLAVVEGRLKGHLQGLAIYTDADGLRGTIDRLRFDPSAVTRTALSKARDLAMADTPGRAVAAIRSLVQAPRASEPMPANPPRQLHKHVPEVLFLSSNGVGLGHLTRLMAIARRLQHARPVFLTMSQAFRVVEASNWPVKYLPFHELSGCNTEHWNQWLRYEIEQVLAERPAIETMVFDGSNPYSGLLAAFSGSAIRKVWIQRGMWKKGHMSADHVRRGKHFDVIVEPSDIAEAAATQSLASSAFDKVVTSPIWLLDQEELLEREAARVALELPTDRPCCLIQLGSGTNRDVMSLFSSIIPALKRAGVVPCVAEWLMGSEVPRIWPGVAYMRLFPISRYLRAFDFSISAAGYNSYHELIGFGVPSIFIANNHHMMDDQSARAEFAMRNDAAIWVEEEAVGNIHSAISMIMQEDVRAMIIEGCRALTPINGAPEAARIVDCLATGVKWGRSASPARGRDLEAQQDNVVTLFANSEAA
jgi:glycosyltransferase involved in cell wall biosynthesis